MTLASCTDRKLKIISILLLVMMLLPAVTMGLTVKHNVLDTECHEDFYCRPECMDKPEGYFCDCGPGFIWNSHSCVSEAVDSSIIFSNRVNASYAVINNRIKILPRLEDFTLATFFKLYFLNESGTLFSSRVDSIANVTLVRYNSIDNQFVIEAANSKFEFFVEKLEPNRWFHLAWSSQSVAGSSSQWSIFVTPPDSETQQFHKNLPHVVNIPERAEIFLGQSSPNIHNQFDLANAFIGELSHFNIWSSALSKPQVLELLHDCIHRYCGNEIEWSDFRYGTRGNVHLKWPSGVQFGGREVGQCKSLTQLQWSCDLNCSLRMGAQCKAGIDANIEWPRTKAGNMSTVPCPTAVEVEANETDSRFAYRGCYKNQNQQGVWSEPNYLNCVSTDHMIVLNKTVTLVKESQRCTVGLHELHNLILQMQSVANSTIYKNPIDLHVMIEALENVTLAWQQQADCRDKTGIASTYQLDQLKSMFSTLLELADNLMSIRNLAGWNATRPPGQECWHLFGTLHRAFILHVRDLVQLRESVAVDNSDMHLLFKGDNIVVKVSSFDPNKFNGDALPDKGDEAKLEEQLRALGAIGVQSGSIRDDATVAEETELNYQLQLIPTTSITIILALYPNGHQLLPHVHLKADWKKSLGKVPRIEDNVNSALFHSLIFRDSDEVRTELMEPIRTRLKFSNNVNISDVKCVRINFHDKRETHWRTKGCWLEQLTDQYATCACNSTGLQAVTTDMYNDDLNKNNETLKLLAYPSYIGCAVSSVLCFTTCVLLIYFRTATNTAKIHQHFSLAIACGQLAFVFGIDKMWHLTLCHWMALLIHYFYLTSFSWLMNEAFNLYIVITYAAHSHQDGSEEGGMWRYYLIGWIVPIALVGTFRGVDGDNYYAKNMCWSSSVWLYAGPAISIVAITVMVLVFTAKEHHESSYTKDEKSNRAIAIHSKALWSQVILLSVSWSFAFVSITMHDIIVKLLFAMFNCLQGVFFVVFYFLLNEEVQNKYLEHQKQRLIAMQELQGDHDVAGEERTTEMHLIGQSGTESVDSKRQLRKRPCASARSQRLDSADHEEDEDQSSDCEMIVTSV